MNHLQPQLGAFGTFGGRFAPELLSVALSELCQAFEDLLPDPGFRAELDGELASWAGRPTPLSEAPTLSDRSGLRIFLKREDLLHGGAHKTNNVIGQALMARRAGKKRLIAETGAGQHGVATAMAGARYGLEVVVYMGARDIERQDQNVELMRRFGAEVRPVRSGEASLKEAINEALRDWAESVQDTHYVLGTVCGPDPFPRLVAALQRVIGDEARSQILSLIGATPDVAVACVGGGSNALGLWKAFYEDETRLVGAEPAGPGRDDGFDTIGSGRVGILHGARTRVLQDSDGQTLASRSIAAGLDYPGVGPEHAWLADSSRATYAPVTDREALLGLDALAKGEGILCALESAHAVALAMNLVERGLATPGETVLVGLSGNGRKDAPRLPALFGEELRP